ncbi:MAG TPA: DUF115 domain-containing protein [Thermoplasmata archaeon]|nr:DUF115 domain-containing protein [Thermoplasmata archaeon]
MKEDEKCVRSSPTPFEKAYPDISYHIEGYSSLLSQRDLIEEISKEMGFSEKEDRESALILEKEIRKNKKIYSVERTIKRLGALIRNKSAFVVGAADCLDEDLNSFMRMKEEGLYFTPLVLIAADSSLEGMLNGGLFPHVVVTDLDGPLEMIIQHNRQGGVTVVLAHGHNKEAIKKCLPKMRGYLLGTTQRESTGVLFNFGGFTDGDRAVFLAKHFEAKEIVLLGFDFEKVGVRYSCVSSFAKKREKLKWCKKILDNIDVMRLEDLLKKVKN